MKRRERVSNMVEELGAELCSLDVPFELKRRIIKMTVSDALLNVNEGWFRIEGLIRGAFSIQDGEFANTLAGRGSSRRSGWRRWIRPRELETG